MATPAALDVGSTLQDLERYLAEHHLLGAGLPREAKPAPRHGNAAAHWDWAVVRSGLLQSGRIVTVGPDGMTGMRSVVGVEARQFPIHMNAQILMPGERTECHRTMRSETRLVVEAPPEAVFVCEFEAFPMERGDVVISPMWTFHDHWNPGTTPAIWVDAYDDGHYQGAPMNEKLPNGALYQEVTRPAGYSQTTLGHARRPDGGRPFPLPPMHYRWRDTSAALRALQAEGASDACDGVYLMLASPVDNGPTLPTFAWHAQLLSPGQRTRAHRHNSTAWYHVFEGSGATVIEGERLEWSKGDLFAIPAWKWHYHDVSSTGESILFSVDDWPAMTALGHYWKEEAAA
ncbi:MAG TPA: cupin domain-containing protein [Chloroflexota bacterium]|nr:cupin domain-containing protein [Chloroflexota bacterium]